MLYYIFQQAGPSFFLLLIPLQDNNVLLIPLFNSSVKYFCYLVTAKHGNQQRNDYHHKDKITLSTSISCTVKILVGWFYKLSGFITRCICVTCTFHIISLLHIVKILWFRFQDIARLQISATYNHRYNLICHAGCAAVNLNGKVLIAHLYQISIWPNYIAGMSRSIQLQITCNKFQFINSRCT